MEKFYEGELIIYQNGENYEIGKIKRIVEDGAFVYYSSGETAAKTPFDCMHKINNAFTIIDTTLGGKPHYPKEPPFNYSGEIPIEDEEIPDMCGIKETATRFGVHIHHMRYLALSGKIKAVRVGKGAGKILINQQSVIDYFNNSSINESDEEKTINGIKPIPVKL